MNAGVAVYYAAGCTDAAGCTGIERHGRTG
jgi:hypothetical protein